MEAAQEPSVESTQFSPLTKDGRWGFSSKWWSKTTTSTSGRWTSLLRSPMRSGSAVSTMISCRILLWSIRRMLKMGRLSPCRDTNSLTLGLSEPPKTIRASG